LRLAPRKTQKIAKSLIWFGAVSVIGLLLFIIGYLLVRGLPYVSWSFLTQGPTDMGRAGGILPTIVGTLLVTVVAIAVATPLGVGTARYLTEYTR
jgi:phosphate transport system permease protein